MILGLQGDIDVVVIPPPPEPENYWVQVCLDEWNGDSIAASRKIRGIGFYDIIIEYLWKELWECKEGWISREYIVRSTGWFPGRRLQQVKVYVTPELYEEIAAVARGKNLGMSDVSSAFVLEIGCKTSSSPPDYQKPTESD